MADHEREAIAGRASYFHILNDVVELERHKPNRAPLGNTAPLPVPVNIIRFLTTLRMADCDEELLIWRRARQHHDG